MLSYQACYNSYDFKDAPLPHPREVEEIDSVLHRKKYIADLYNEKNSLVKEMRYRSRFFRVVRLLGLCIIM